MDEKSIAFILQGSWMSVVNFILVHQMGRQKPKCHTRSQEIRKIFMKSRAIPPAVEIFSSNPNAKVVEPFFSSSFFVSLFFSNKITVGSHSLRIFQWLLNFHSSSEGNLLTCELNLSRQTLQETCFLFALGGRPRVWWRTAFCTGSIWRDGDRDTERG